MNDNFICIKVDREERPGSYTYLWSNGETTQSIDTLAMGSYSVIVTDL